jgi:hypothetical protein
LDLDVEILDETYAKAKERLRTLSGATEAEAEDLFKAMLRAAARQALELTTGSGPVPSNLTAARAEYIHFVCLEAGRILDQREVEVLLRATTSAARSVFTTMRATYEEALRSQFLARMREDVQVRSTGNVDSGLRWSLVFSETSTYEMARAELFNGDFADAIETDLPTKHSIELARARRGDDALAHLGIDQP